MADLIIQDLPFEPYLREVDIQARIAELGEQLNRDYRGKSPLMLVVLNGAFLFAADLVRHLTIEPEIQFIRISTYGNSMTSSHAAQVLLGLDVEVEGREVILVEDIVDSGYTTDFFVRHLTQQQPASVCLLTLLFKPDNFTHERKPDYIGFEIAPEFVVGYGMDYAQQGRELRDIYKLKQ
jgi:hypoxanthine phosphoribosyltransferase